MKKFLTWSRKYLSFTALAVVAALVFFLFFQENSTARIYGYQRTIDSLRHEIALNRDSLEHYRKLNERLDNHDPAIIEQVVRENHNMNRIDEDVYLVD